MESLFKELTSHLLRSVSGHIAKGETEKIVEMGIRQEHLAALHKIKPACIRHLIDMPSRMIDLQVDIDELVRLLSVRDFSLAKKENGYEEVTLALLQGISVASSDLSKRSQLKSALGIDNAIACILAEKTTSELHAIVDSGAMFYSVTIKEPEFSLALNYVILDEEENEERNKLITYDAPLPMFTALTGLKKAVYQDLRRELFLPSFSGGGTRHLTESEEMCAWDLWQESKSIFPISRNNLNAIKRSLYVCPRTHGLTLRLLWPYISKWLKLEEQESILRG